MIAPTLPRVSTVDTVLNRALYFIAYGFVLSSRTLNVGDLNDARRLLKSKGETLLWQARKGVTFSS
mgnify:CR=1 FL=1